MTRSKFAIAMTKSRLKWSSTKVKVSGKKRGDLVNIYRIREINCTNFLQKGQQVLHLNYVYNTEGLRRMNIIFLYRTRERFSFERKLINV